MQEERKNGNGNYGAGGGEDNGDPQFTTPGAGQQLDETEAAAGGPIPGPMEGQGGEPRRAEEPPEQPARRAKATPRKKGTAKKKKNAGQLRSKAARKQRQMGPTGRARSRAGKKAKGKRRTAAAGRGQSSGRGSPKAKRRKGNRGTAGRKKGRR